MAAIAAALGFVSLPRLEPAGVATLAALLALIGWVGLSIVWSVAGDRSWSALNKGLVYVLFLLAGILLGCHGGRCCRVAAGLLAVVLGLALAWALAGKAFPDLFPDGGRIARLRNPVGYWNALALLADAALPLGLWLATAFAARRWRVAGALLFYAAVLTGLLTQSRAGVAAAVGGLALWLWLVGDRRVEGGTRRRRRGPARRPRRRLGVHAPRARRRRAVYSQRVDDGAVFGVLAVLGATLAAASVLLPLGRLAQERRRAVGRALVAGAALGVLLGGAGVVAAGRFSQRECANQPSRLGSVCANNRLEWWGEALEIWRDRPLAAPVRARSRSPGRDIREDATAVTQPHSVPLQALAGGGIVGLLLLVTAGSAAAVGVTRSLQRLDGPERAAAAALAVFPLVWALHALVDYDVEFVAVTAPMLIAVGALLAAGRPPRRRPRWLAVAAAGAAALAVIGSVGSPALAARGVERAYELIDAGDVSEAAELARRAEGSTHSRCSRSGRVPGQRRAETRRRRTSCTSGRGAQPENADAWHALGLFRLAVLRDSCGAYQALNRAYTLDPKSRRWTPGGPLDVARDAVKRVPASGGGSPSGLVEESRPICGPPVDNEVLHSPSRLKSWAVDNASEVGRGRPRQGADVSRARCGRSSRRR